MSQYSREVVNISVGRNSSFVLGHWINIMDANYDYLQQGNSGLDDSVFVETKESQGAVVKRLPRALMISAAEDFCPYSVPSETPSFSFSGAPESTENSVNEEENCTYYTPNNKPPQKIPSIELDRAENLFLADKLHSQSLGDLPAPLLRSHYDLSDVVGGVNDFMSADLAHNSIYCLPKIGLDYSSEDQFNDFRIGEQIWRQNTINDHVEDRIRILVEPCNNVQGFNLLFDSECSYSGLAGSIADYLKHEYGAKALISYPCIFGRKYSKMSDYMRRLCSIIHGISWSNEYSNMLVPLGTLEGPWRSIDMCYRNYYKAKMDHNKVFHQSAFISQALDVISTIYRHESLSENIMDMCRAMTVVGRKLAFLGSRFPISISPKTFDPKLFDDFPDLFESASPHISYENWSISLCRLGTRGLLPVSKNYAPGVSQTDPSILRYLHDKMPRSHIAGISMCDRPIRLPPTFPPLIDDNEFLDKLKINEYGQLSSVSAGAAFFQDHRTKKYLSSLIDCSQSVRRNIVVKENLEENSEMLESIYNLSECYEEGWRNL